MSIKPCPACGSDEIGRASLEYSAKHKRVCVDPECGAQGPWAKDEEAADTAWNAMPRRGDGPAWRSEPPDEPGWWWWRRLGWDGKHTEPHPFYVDEHRIGWEALGPAAEYAGPLPMPPAPDAEKEAAK